jgi:hypothetical protein
MCKLPHVFPHLLPFSLSAVAFLDLNQFRLAQILCHRDEKHNFLLSASMVWQTIFRETRKGQTKPSLPRPMEVCWLAWLERRSVLANKLVQGVWHDGIGENLFDETNQYKLNHPGAEHFCNTKRRKFARKSNAYERMPSRLRYLYAPLCFDCSASCSLPYYSPSQNSEYVPVCLHCSVSC